MFDWFFILYYYLRIIILMHFLHWIFSEICFFLPRRIAVVYNVDLFFRDLIGLWGRKHHTSLLKEHFAVIFPFRHYNILLWNHSGFLDFIHRRHTTKFSGLKKLDEKNGGGEELLGIQIYYKKGGTSDIRLKLLFTSLITKLDLCQDRKVSSFISWPKSAFNEVNS